MPLVLVFIREIILMFMLEHTLISNPNDFSLALDQEVFEYASVLVH